MSFNFDTAPIMNIPDATLDFGQSYRNYGQHATIHNIHHGESVSIHGDGAKNEQGSVIIHGDGAEVSIRNREQGRVIINGNGAKVAVRYDSEGTLNEVSTMTGVIDASTNATIKLQNILTDSNIRKFEDSDQKLLDRMRRQYIYLMDDLHGPSWHYRIESFNIKAGYLASLATVSTFLGAVQVSLVAFTATIAASNAVHQVIYFFSYCGLSFDAYGAIFALFTSGSLLSLTSKAKALASEELDEEIKYQLVAFKKLCDTRTDRTTAPLRLNDEMRERFKDFSSSCEKKHDNAQRLAFVIKHHLQDVFDVIWIVIAGVAFFFVSLITFIVGTQATGVIASSIAAIGVSGLGLLYMQVYRHPGIRRRLKKALVRGRPRPTDDHRLQTVEQESSVRIPHLVAEGGITV